MVITCLHRNMAIIAMYTSTSETLRLLEGRAKPSSLDPWTPVPEGEGSLDDLVGEGSEEKGGESFGGKQKGQSVSMVIMSSLGHVHPNAMCRAERTQAACGSRPPPKLVVEGGLLLC